MRTSRFFAQIPNIITTTRILGVGLIFWLTPYQSQFWQLVAISIFAIVGATDFLDGWVARRYKLESDIGKVLDPLADKILVLVFLPLLEMQMISSFPVFIILAREFAIMALRVVGAKQNANIQARLSGKLKTAFTLPVCGILLGRVISTPAEIPALLQPLALLQTWVYSWPTWVITTLIWLTVIVTIWSFFDYFKQFLWHAIVQHYKGNETRAKKAIMAVFPNTFTLLNLACGVCAVIVSWFGHYPTAVSLVLIGIMLDAVDGSLARKLDVSSALGAKLDSKADILSFGFTPPIVIYNIISASTLPMPKLLGILFGGLYGVSVAYRLRRFDKKGGHSDVFEGLPSPIGAAIVMVAAISAPLSTPMVYIPIVILASALMASTIAYMHFRIASRHLFLKYFVWPTFLFFILTILSLLNIRLPHLIYTYEILFGLTMWYVLSPLFTKPPS